MATDLLGRVRSEIDVRLSELRPAVSEYERLLSATDALVVKINDEPLPLPPAPITQRAASKPAARPRRGRPPGGGGSAASTPAASAPAAAKKQAPRRRRSSARAERERAVRSETGQAIVAALEHGSHTVAELVVVTALPAADIRDSLRGLSRERAVVKARREGKAAYTLPAVEA
jgi:hypothetical protein